MVKEVLRNPTGRYFLGHQGRPGRRLPRDRQGRRCHRLLLELLLRLLLLLLGRNRKARDVQRRDGVELG